MSLHRNRLRTLLRLLHCRMESRNAHTHAGLIRFPYALKLHTSLAVGIIIQDVDSRPCRNHGSQTVAIVLSAHEQENEASAAVSGSKASMACKGFRSNKHCFTRKRVALPAACWRASACCPGSPCGTCTTSGQKAHKRSCHNMTECNQKMLYLLSCPKAQAHPYQGVSSTASGRAAVAACSGTAHPDGSIAKARPKCICRLLLLYCSWIIICCFLTSITNMVFAVNVVFCYVDFYCFSFL